MANHVVVGAGPAGLYTAYRLLKNLAPGDTVQVYEWSERPGGRIYTFRFPEGNDHQFAEVGGMRFATDPQSFNTHLTPESDTVAITNGHVLVQNMIVELGLAGEVLGFEESPERMYYLRGKTFHENYLQTTRILPYNFNAEFDRFVQGIQEPLTADNVLAAIGSKFGPRLQSEDSDVQSRAQWCKYFSEGQITTDNASPAYPAGTFIKDIGYWNLLYDQLGDEGFDYAADGNGYTSNVINWNAADAMQANDDYGSTTQYSRLNGGYSRLFDALADAIEALSPGCIRYGQQLTSLQESPEDDTTLCYFNGSTEPVVADHLFLAMPRRALEMVAQGCPPDYMLNRQDVRYYLESSIDQPSIKVLMVFDQAWYTSPEICTHRPNLVPPSNALEPATLPISQMVGGPTITDLPLRMVYYFGNNVQGTAPESGGPYVVLASYDDMSYTNFWRELENTGDFTTPPSQSTQPLTGPTSVEPDSPFARLLLKQLAEVHGAEVSSIPRPIAVYYQDWGQDPFGGGYHGWAPHFDICKVMHGIRAPYQNILPASSSRNVYIIGSCYSFDQAWVEGAFCTAESVLRDYVHLKPFRNVSEHYTLVCSPQKPVETGK